MDQLWTPWRFPYVTSSRRKATCIFCDLLAQEDDRQNFILLRGDSSFLILNLFPYTLGHLMVVSSKHVATLNSLSPEEVSEMILLARQCERVLEEVYRPDGFNMGLNLGKSAGAGVAGHVHMHVVPRWEGDANFVSVVGETRIMPEELTTTYQKLSPHFAAKK